MENTSVWIVFLLKMTVFHIYVSFIQGNFCHRLHDMNHKSTNNRLWWILYIYIYYINYCDIYTIYWPPFIKWPFSTINSTKLQLSSYWWASAFTRLLDGPYINYHWFVATPGSSGSPLKSTGRPPTASNCHCFPDHPLDDPWKLARWPYPLMKAESNG